LSDDELQLFIDMYLTPQVLAKRTLPTGRKAEVIPLTFGRARIALVNERNEMVYDDLW
jgi:hypothetical protein